MSMLPRCPTWPCLSAGVSNLRTAPVRADSRSARIQSVRTVYSPQWLRNHVAQQHAGVPHADPHPLFEISMERLAHRDHLP